MSPRASNPAGRGVRRAFTLAEMAVALVVTAVVLLAAQSAVLLASKAVPDADSAQVLRVRAADGMQRMLAELSVAKTLKHASEHRVSFTVQDRDADGVDETITYSWSGTKGDAIVRTGVDGATETVVPGVQGLALAYDTSTAQDPTAFVTSPETTLASGSGLLGLGSSSVTFVANIAQVFTPSLPADAVSFTATRASVSLKANGAATGTSVVRLRTAWNNTPTTATVDAASVLESSLSTLSFQTVLVTFPGAVPLTPGTPLALVVQCAAGSPSCTVQTSTLALAASGQNMLTSADGGQSWSSAALQMMPYTLYGTVTTLDKSRTVTRCMNVRCSIAAGPLGAARVCGNARVLNEPVMP